MFIKSSHNPKKLIDYKVLKIVIIFLFLLIVICLCLILFLKNPNLRSLEKDVREISFPTGIEKIAIKSAIGDSGGNGNYSTLRVVLVVKTEMSMKEVDDTIKQMNLRFPNHYKSTNNIPIFYITHCESSQFKSPRQFMLRFKELKGISDYSNYYFIEFVE